MIFTYVNTYLTGKINKYNTVCFKYIVLFLIAIFVHYELKMFQYKYCTKNMFLYYLMKNSNLCIFLDTYSQIIEQCISVKLDMTINKIT
jgi:hypothetical protein